VSDDDTNTAKSPTRREYLKYGGAVVGGGLLAGCVGQTDSGTTSPDTDTPDGTTASAATATHSTPKSTESASTTEPSPYEVCMEPTGCAAFERVPERWYSLTGPWADMAVALGQVGDATAMLNAPTFYFDAVDVSVPDRVVTEWGAATRKETFYELDSDVHFIDPNTLMSWTDWEQADVDEIEENVGPFFGVRLARYQADYQRDYPRYSLYEGFEKAASVFREWSRYEAFEILHEEVRSRVESKTEDVSEKRTVGLLNSGSRPEKGEFYPITLSGEGSEMDPYLAVPADDGFAGYTSEWAEVVDYETLLEADPDTLVVHWGIGMSESDFQAKFVEPMQDHPVGSELTAVENDRVLQGTYSESGPIGQLFDLELLAKQLYPELFGAYEGRESFLNSPSNTLFDRGRVADIIDGDSRR
jgi:iron complex transport system substrate-binding protein